MEEEINRLIQTPKNQNQETLNNADCKIMLHQDESSISSNEYRASNEECLIDNYIFTKNLEFDCIEYAYFIP